MKFYMIILGKLHKGKQPGYSTATLFNQIDSVLAKANNWIQNMTIGNEYGNKYFFNLNYLISCFSDITITGGYNYNVILNRSNLLPILQAIVNRISKTSNSVILEFVVPDMVEEAFSYIKCNPLKDIEQLTKGLKDFSEVLQFSLQHITDAVDIKLELDNTDMRILENEAIFDSHLIQPANEYSTNTHPKGQENNLRARQQLRKET